jgi:predicted permease
MIELCQTVRRLLRAPGFTAIAVLTLAIGIGATTTIFSVINGVLIKPLPFFESERLVSLMHRYGEDGRALPASTAYYFIYRDNSATFESVALWAAGTAGVTGAGVPEEVDTLRMTFEFLPILGVVPTLGRAFSASDDQPGSERTVILSHDYWQRLFGGAETALGRTLTIDGTAHTVIGVLPRGFRFLQQGADVLVPIQPNHATTYFGPFAENGIARLREGVTLAEASADVERMIPIVMDTFPTPGADLERMRTAGLQPALEFLKETFVGDLDKVLWILMGTIGILLAVACANVANLHLVRSEMRSQDLAIRAALGASGGKIARNLLEESVLLALAGGALGLVLAYVGLRVLLAAAANEFPSVLEVTIDPTVLAFAFVTSLASGLLFGAAAALRYAGPRISTMLSSAGRAQGTSRERQQVRHSLIVAQVAFAMVLLVASGLMIRTFQSLRDVDPGFVAPDQVQTVGISIPQAVVPEFARAVRIMNDIQERIAAIPGVVSVGFASQVPLSGRRTSSGFVVEGAPESAVPPQNEFRYTSPNFFETLGTPLVAGRTFEWADHHDARQVAIVSQSFAIREWGSEAEAVGRRIRMSPTLPWREIVGVVGDIHHENLDRPAPSAVYLTLGEPLSQFLSRTVTFVVRSERVGMVGFLEDLQRAVWSLNSNLPLGSVQTLGDLYDRSMARTSLTLVLLAIAGSMALGLGLVGIYGVISYMLSLRTREIGIRMALGAHSASLKRLLLRQVLALVLVGTALGLGGAVALAQVMKSQLFGVTALDPATYATVAILLVATAAIAGYLPARHVTRVDPMQALRSE